MRSGNAAPDSAATADTSAGPAAALAVLGSPNARLLAGIAGREDLTSHRNRFAAVHPAREQPDRVFSIIAQAGIRGRGGGYFPLAEKLTVARRTPGPAVVVVNATESEPASRKDRHLMLNRPHLALDGAQFVAAAAGADRLILAVHTGPAADSLREALAERGDDPVPPSIVVVPDRYVAGESSAMVSWINGGPPLPAGRTVTTAVRGVDGRPTVVSNIETVCHAALLVDGGPGWFRAVGPASAPGSLLITVAGDVGSPGRVLEVVGPATVGHAVEAAGGPSDHPVAVLIGGYAGTWQPAQDVWDLPIDHETLSKAGSPIGCGLIGVVGAGRCGLREAARLAGWLSSQRAGQCGACDAGLPELAGAVVRLAEGTAGGRRGVRRIASLGDAVSGRNLCHLPDGTVAMVESAVTTFWEEIALHRKRRCSGRVDDALFPTPERTAGLAV